MVFFCLSVLVPTPVQILSAPPVTADEDVTEAVTATINPIKTSGDNQAKGATGTGDDPLPNIGLSSTESDSMVSVQSSATYAVTFQGNWTTASTPGGVVSSAHFTTLIGAIHNDMVTFWESGGTATPGVENVAELGSTGTFKSEINANSNAISVVEKGVSGGGTGSAAFDITLTNEHPLVTLLSMIGPSPDWFVGVSGLSLLNTQGQWMSTLEVDLFPYDAGTEEGTEFSLSNPATSPQGVITSIKGIGKFSNVRMARLTFTRQTLNTAPSFTSGTSFEVDENRTAVGTVVARDPDRGDEVTYGITGGADASQFQIGEATGALTFATPPNYERPADVTGTDPVNAAANNEYIVTVTATGGTADRAMTAEQTLTVTVGNLEEAGTVSFSKVGAEIRAELSDPDGGVSSPNWQWARSSNRRTGWGNIGSATSASYTPSSDDDEMYLRARVSYEDGQGSGKQSQGVSTYEITPPQLLVSTPVSGLSIPWDLAFTPDGTMLFTQRAGVLSSRGADGTVETVDADFADVVSTGENGLMGIVVDPDFASNRRFYTCQAHVGPEIQVIAWSIDAAYTIATRVDDPLVGDIPTASSRHGGCRLRFGPKGYLWIATGDAATGTVPQDLTSFGGKVLRVDPTTGAGAPTNPFAPSRVYTYGHRNMQGLALRPGTSQMWSVEHGPEFDDEINLLVAGRNYGWDPVPGYNQGVPMTDLVKFPGAIEARWSSGSSTLATSGGIFLEGVQWGVWEGRLAVATLKDSKLRLFEFTPEGDYVSQVVVPEFDGAYGRLRTPMMGPDGALYVTTSNGGGQDRILRVIKDEAIPVTLKLTPDSIGENGGVSTVMAGLDRASKVVTTVVVSATAVAPAVLEDFTLSQNRTLTIPAGERSSTGVVTVRAVDNSVDAPDTMVTVSGTAENINGVTPPSAVTLRIVDDDSSPVITTTSPILVVENQKAVATLTATDADRPAEDLAWAIAGGADRDKFILTADGKLDFTAAKDYEEPDDADRDRDYEVTVQVSDGANPVEGALTVRLLDVDDSAPMLSPPTVNGTMLTLTYDEPLDGSSTPEAGDFTVAGGSQPRTVTGVRVSGSTALLTLDAGVEHGETGIQLSYTPWNNPIRDAVGNEAGGVSREPVRNDTPDTTPPAVSSLAIDSNPGVDGTYAAGDGIEVTVTFSETVEVEGAPRLRLRVGTRTRVAGYLRGTGTAAPVFGYEVVEGDEDSDGVSIDAGRVALNGGTIKDEAKNSAELVHEAVAAQAGHKVDGVRPSFLSTAVDGASLTLTYREGLDGGSRPASGDFTVEVDGVGRSVSGVSISGSVVTLTLNPAVEHGDTGIRVSYTAGTSPIQDEVGNDARGLSNQSVTNTTGAPNTAPEITTRGPLSVGENQVVVRLLAARDTDAGDEVTGWAIAGGADQGQFAITSDTGELSFREAPDYEMPVDLASPVGDNEYVVEVSVRSGAGARELEAEQTLTVRVTDEPEPPGVPDAPVFSGETADSLTVSWSEPDNTGPAITDYDVQYREKGTGRFTGALHDGPGRTLTISDLKSGTIYEVQVRATNDEGMSDWSDPGEGRTVASLTLEMMTMEEPPVSGPFTVRFSFSEPVTGFSASDIETGQDPACVDDQNNTVFCDPGIGALQTTDDRVFTITVTPRTDRVAHSYRLTLTVAGGAVRSSVGSKSSEEPEEPLEVRVAPPGVEEPISSLGLTASGGNGTVRLSWNRPTDNGGSAIIRYEYRYQAVGETWSEWEKVGAGTRGVTVENLINGREYIFEVRAVNALGKGGAETVQATPERRIAPPPPPRGGGGGGGGLLFPPEAPLGLMAMPGDGAVRLEWSPPESDGGTPILRYEYRLKEGRGAFGEWTPIADSAPGEVNASGYTVGVLGNGTVYVFELRGVNLVGNGRESEAVEVVMLLDRVYWSNFLAGDLQGVEASLERGPFGGGPQSLRLRFGADLRFEESELDGEGEVRGTRSGSYGYRYTSRTTGELSLDYDGEESCELRLTFSREGAGSYGYRCGGVLGGQGSFRMSGLNRGPEIASAGAYEVAENTTRVGRVEAVDGDDEIGGYGIAGGADEALFEVEAETGELLFREAPDYETPGDVESDDPRSGAGDNEYVVVVEVRSGEGERERRGSRAIRVRVADEEEPPEITSVGPFEVVENQTMVGQLEAVDQDKQDEITEYGIAGGADGGLFAVEAETGELMFREAPDYEDPSDVESEEPASGAADNEYIVVVEVRSGEGERERKGRRAIRVRVSDEEEPPGAPGAPVVTAEGSDSLQVSWREPENRGPEITDYEVRYREGGEAGYSDGGHEGRGLEVRLSGLKEGTVYEVQVRAVNEEGMSEWSEPGEGRTDMDEADPDDPSNFTEGDLEGRRLRLRLEGEEGSAGSLELRFGEGNRFEQIESGGQEAATRTEGAARSGSYTYEKTGPSMGTVRLAYDDGASCEIRLSFTESGVGAFAYDCGEGDPAEGSFRLTTGSLFVPVILSSAGQNQSFFTSELTLTNRGDQDVKLDYSYTAERGGGSGTASEVLAAGRQRVETDALTYLRGLGIAIPETGNRIGTLRVEVRLGSEVEAVVRTTTLVPEGRAGLAYLGVAEEEGYEEAVYLCGLRQNDRDRSNVAFQNMGAPEAGAITVRTTVYSGEAADGTARVLDDIELEPGKFHQYSGLLGVLGVPAQGYVKVERVEGRAPFYAYGVINDQANSDGSFVFPVTAGSLEGTAGQTLPVVVETSEFRSELTVTNFSEEPRRLDFQFVAEGIEAAGNTAAFSMRLEAGRQEIIAEVVEELRQRGVAGLGSTRGFYAGPLFVEAEGGDMSGIVIGARTGSEGGGGSYSVFYNAVPEGAAFTGEAWVDGLQQDEENRSNLALVNTGEVDESPSVFHLEIYDGETGLLAETVVTQPIPPRGWHQINGILGSYAPETGQGYIRIEKVSGENPFLAYGVVNDGGAPGQRSGDGAYLPARE